MAACLMLSGVGKSGSPAPKSTTSTPSARSFSASDATFMVDDTLMEEMRSAIGFMAVCISVWLCPFQFRFRHPLLQPHLHRGRHQAGNIPAEAEDFFHQAGTDKRIGLVGHHKDGLN